MAGSFYDAIRHPWQAYMLVSLDMPEANLVQLARESASTRIPLVINGFPASAPTLEATRRRIASLNRLCCGDKGGTSWVIYPQLFQQYRVQQVPAFLLVQQGRRDANGFTRVVGDISLADALKRIAQQSRLPAMREAAGRYYDAFRN
jgi:conjugal transfer pilus assembly protein TrbC